jgi:hypothetical protein
MDVKQLEISPCVLNLIKMILGNARELNKFYLGVCKYQKIENPWPSLFWPYLT